MGDESATSPYIHVDDDPDGLTFFQRHFIDHTTLTITYRAGKLSLPLGWGGRFLHTSRAETMTGQPHVHVFPSMDAPELQDKRNMLKRYGIEPVISATALYVRGMNMHHEHEALMAKTFKTVLRQVLYHYKGRWVQMAEWLSIEPEVLVNLNKNFPSQHKVRFIGYEHHEGPPNLSILMHDYARKQSNALPDELQNALNRLRKAFDDDGAMRIRHVPGPIVRGPDVDLRHMGA